MLGWVGKQNGHDARTRTIHPRFSSLYLQGRAIPCIPRGNLKKAGGGAVPTPKTHGYLKTRVRTPHRPPSSIPSSLPSAKHKAAKNKEKRKKQQQNPQPTTQSTYLPTYLQANMHGNDCPKCGAASDGSSKSCSSCGAVSPLLSSPRHSPFTCTPLTACLLPTPLPNLTYPRFPRCPSPASSLCLDTFSTMIG